jgi:ABC-type cobalamin/Fe3+-siderophores transport system ATPase subunit
MSEPIKVFLSYSLTDKEIVKKIYSGLQQAGFSPWMDAVNIMPGELIESAISEAMDISEVFVFIASNSSSTSLRWNNELLKASDLKKARRGHSVLIIPALLEEDADLPGDLNKIRYLDFSSDINQGMYELIEVLRKFETRKYQHDMYKPSSTFRISRNLLISNIELVNIRCFDKLNINLEENSQPIELAILLGDNAIGKTTLLRSIALGLCNRSDSIALIKSVSGGFVSQGYDKGFIKIKIRDISVDATAPLTDADKNHLLFRALQSAFATEHKLTDLCTELDLDLEEIISVNHTLDEKILILILWMQDEGRLDKLIEIARKKSPNNLSLREFDKQGRTKTYTITTQIIKQTEETEFIEQSIEPDTDFLWSDIFLCGYGSNRTTQTYANYDSYRSIDAVNSLFSSQPKFQDPELVLLRRDPEIRKQIEHLLLDILMLDSSEHKIHYTDRGIEVEGPWGRQPLQVMSDGYLSTTQWVLDFMGWLIQANRLLNNPDIGGILLIDEIEQHLHPRWQRHILQRLRQKFPKTQIIASTHTPLVAAGIADIDSGVLLKLGQDAEGHTDVRIIDKRFLDGKRADQILTSEAFGLFTSRNPGSQDDVDRYSELLSNSARTEEEETEFQSLRSHIQDVFNDGESDAAQIVRKAVGVALQETVQDISPELIDLELKKQLQQLSQPEAQQ